MGAQDSGRSPELDEVRRALFPFLSSEEGWENIDRAIRGAGDGERWAAIEEAASPLTDEEWTAIEDAAKQQDLSADLLELLRQARQKDRDA